MERQRQSQSDLIRAKRKLYTGVVKRFVSTHLPIILGYVLFVTLIRFQIDINTVWLALGVTVGVYLLFLDRIVYTFAYPQEQLSQHFTWLWRSKRYVEAFALLDARREEQQRLTFRSALFMLMWIPLALFALTSTPSLFGKGVVMGLMLHIIYDSWRLQRTRPEVLHARLFWQIKKVVGQEERMMFLIAISIVFMVLSFWLR